METRHNLFALTVACGYVTMHIVGDEGKGPRHIPTFGLPTAHKHAGRIRRSRLYKTLD